MPTKGSQQRKMIREGLDARRESGENITIDVNKNNVRAVPGENLVVVNGDTKAQCLACVGVYGSLFAPVHTLGVMGSHEASCPAKGYVNMVDGPIPETTYAVALARAPSIDEQSEMDIQEDEGNETNKEEKKREEVMAWSKYCSTELFNKGQDLYKVDALSSYMELSGRAFMYGSNKKPTKDLLMLAVRNTPPYFNKEHPFWSTLE